ncbi:hypothetical protein A2U01_0034841, partial [Trifolium medium]|nr:hypothetical protein [Trifolium medium]
EAKALLLVVMSLRHGGDDDNPETVTKDAESLEGGNPKDSAPTLSATYSSSGHRDGTSKG